MGVPPQAPAKKSKAPLLIGILGGLLLVGGIVVLILFLTVWKGGGTAGGTDTPVALAEKYIKAMENKDVDAYMDCFDPSYFSTEDNPILEEMGMDVKKMLEMSFQYIEVRFKGVELKVQSEKGDSAVVVTTAGSLSMSFMGMGEEIDLSDEAMEFDMVKKSGRWYLTKDPLPTGMSMEGGVDEYFDQDTGTDNMEEFLPEEFDTEDLMDLLPEDFNLQELEELLPEGFSLEDLENMDLDDLRRLLEELEPYLEEMMPESNSGGGKPV
jgi:ketosteroid isomerase-like protein